MIRIFGPCNRRFTLAIENGQARKIEGTPYISSASSFGEAIVDYCNAYKIEIKPCDAFGGKYFTVTTSGHRFEGAIYDPHIFRGDEQICPKQDCSFQFADNDVLDLGGPLGC